MARTTLATLIQRVRELAAAGTADYTIGTAAYWSDDAVQAVLDRNRLDFVDELLQPLREYDGGGTARYYVHQSTHGNLEATDGGTAILYVRRSSGARLGTADYGVDTQAGRITFVADTGGSAFYLTARTYDVYAAAAEVWRLKAAQVAQRFDFTADGASFKASQLVAQYQAQADACSAMATFGSGAAGLRTSTMYRSDVMVYGYDDDRAE